MYLVIDVGATYTKYGYFNKEGFQCEHGKITTVCTNKKEFYQSLLQLKTTNLKGVALSMPGLIDSFTGTIHAISLLPFLKKTQVKDELEALFDLPVSLENDAKCATLGEMWKGHLQNIQNGLFIVLGSGIGGTIIIDGHIINGPKHKAGEIEVHPIIWTQIMEVHFYMAKLTRKQKIEIYEKRKEGVSISQLSKQYCISHPVIEYLCRLIDMHGVDILRKDKNVKYSKIQKEEIVNQVLIYNHSITSTAIQYGLLNKGILQKWIKSYKENDCVIIEKKRGRLPIMKTQPKQKKKYEDMTAEEKIKYLEEKNLYLEAENEALKKLRALVLQRNDQTSEKKR